MKRNTITVLILLLLVSIFLATLLTLPRIDTPKPDPYFHVKITPVIYWIGFCLTIFVTLLIVFSKKAGHGRYGLGLFSVMLLSVYVYDIPRLFYVNPIYTDTYLFVGELLYTLRSGHVGWGHSYGTPGLALFSSQFSLITGIDHIIVAEILPLIMPLIIVFFIYVIAQLFVDKRTALLACLVYISMNWMGFAFNRQSFALLLQMFVYYGIFRVFSRRVVSLSWYTAILLSYIALVVSHPLSSLIMVAAPVCLVALMGLTSLVGRILPTALQGKYATTRQLVTRALLLSTMFSVIWLLWNMYTETNIYYAIQTIDSTIRELLATPGPIEQASSTFTGYTGEYLSIVNLRLFVVVFEAIVGTVLACFALIKTKTSWNGIILSSWFISCMFIFVFGLYSPTHTLLYKTFLYASSAFSVLLAWSITSKTRTHYQSKYNGKASLKTIKGFILSATIFFMLILPFLMYSNTPFMYPPTVYLKEADHITRYGNGSIAIFESSSEIGYYQLLNNASATFTWTDNAANITDYSCIVTTFRAYTKGAFNVYDPPLPQRIMELEQEILNNPNSAFAKVYDGDSWHRIYVKQVGN